MKASLAILLILFLAGLSACRTIDQPPLRKGEPLDVTLRLPANTTQWVEASHRSAGRYGFMGEEIRIEGFTRFVYELRSVQVSEVGDTQFFVIPRIYAVDDQVVTPTGDRVRSPKMEALFKDLEAAIRLHPFTFTVNADGRITHFDGLTELEDSVAGVVSREDLLFDELDPVFRYAWRQVFAAHIDDRPIRRHLLETYGILPKGPVRLGDEWPAPQTDLPWPYLPTKETIRLINQQAGRWYLQTSGEFAPPVGSNWATYKGSKHGNLFADVETGLITERAETTNWKRKKNKTPWEQFTLKSLEASDSVRLNSGAMSSAPALNAINRYPFMESSR